MALKVPSPVPQQGRRQIAREQPIELDAGRIASVLNYNLPERTSYSARNYIALDFLAEWFRGGFAPNTSRIGALFFLYATRRVFQAHAPPRGPLDDRAVDRLPSQV
jgi:hypothetical protein